MPEPVDAPSSYEAQPPVWQAFSEAAIVRTPTIHTETLFPHSEALTQSRRTTRHSKLLRLFAGKAALMRVQNSRLILNQTRSRDRDATEAIQ